MTTQSKVSQNGVGLGWIQAASRIHKGVYEGSKGATRIIGGGGGLGDWGELGSTEGVGRIWGGNQGAWWGSH